MNKKITNTFKIVMTTLLVLFVTNIYSQTKYKGYEYNANADEYYDLKFTRDYEEGDNVFKTIYEIYYPHKGHVFTVIAIHNKLDKEVKVIVKDADGGMLAKIREEKTTYENPSMEPFGFRGTVAALLGSRVPNQLEVKFVSEKYENVQVTQVASSDPYSNNYHFYLLDIDLEE